MAASRAHSDTLTINTVYPVNFPQYFANITVIHRGTTGTIWLRTDGITPVVFASLTPSNSDDNYPVLPGQAVTFPNGILSQEPITRSVNGTSVLLISDTAIPFTVYAS
jgi:hypothetical protein